MAINNYNNDTFTISIQEHNLYLEKYGFVPGNGDCLYASSFNLSQLHGVVIPATDVLDQEPSIVKRLACRFIGRSNIKGQ